MRLVGAAKRERERELRLYVMYGAEGGKEEGIFVGLLGIWDQRKERQNITLKWWWGDFGFGIWGFLCFWVLVWLLLSLSFWQENNTLYT